MVTQIDEEKWEAFAKELELNNMYDKEFFSKNENPKNSNYCNVFTGKDSTDTKAKELCSKLIYHLENISVQTKPQSDNYCNYLRYWLFDEIGKIHTNQSDKVEKIPFLKNLTDAWGKINREKLKYICSPPYVNYVSLKELKTWKLLYIYFKNEDKIQKASMSKDTALCSKYLTYLHSFSSLYDKYKKEKCVPGIFFSAVGPHHFPCKHKYDIKALISSLEDCKKGILPRNIPAAAGVAVSSRVGSLTPAGSRGPERPVSAGRVTNGTDHQVSSPLYPKASLSTIPNVITRHGGLGAQTHTLQTDSDTGHVAIASLPGSSESSSDKMNSNFIRNIILAAAVLGTIFFLFIYNKSSKLKSSFPKRKRNKKIFEHNYYEEYEREFEKYDSGNLSLDSESNRYFLNYQPEGDSYY